MSRLLVGEMLGPVQDKSVWGGGWREPVCGRGLQECRRTGAPGFARVWTASCHQQTDREPAPGKKEGPTGHLVLLNWRGIQIDQGAAS